MSPRRRGSAGVPGPRASRRSSDRVLRLLSIVPWIAAHDGPRVDEVCERFGVDRELLLDDLSIVQLVGLPPYTPDMLIEVTFEGDRVWVRFAEVFGRPLRLTPDQALGLVAASAALTQAGGDPDDQDPLTRGLTKLAGLLGIAPEEAIAIRLGASRPEVLDTLRQALREHRRVHLDYFAYSRAERTTRDVDPYRVVASAGAWYLVGWCHRVGDVRTFRVDRIHQADLLDQVFDGPAPDDGAQSSGILPSGGLDVDAGVPRVVLDLESSAAWVVETYPVEEVVELDGERRRVRLAVASTPWLERLLLRLGPAAQVVEATDPDLLVVARHAAKRVLARYAEVSPQRGSLK